MTADATRQVLNGEATDQFAGARFGPSIITEADQRYASMVRGTNHRFVGQPDYVCVVKTAEQVRAAVAEAVASGKRIAVRSGGHGFEDFTASAEIKVLLDISEMSDVYYDARMKAFAIESGASLGHLYRTLFKGWGVTIPAGECPEVGVGGHFAGGGYGPLSRRYGSLVDYLYAVEVVVVDADGQAKTIIATREPQDPHRELWWAHTGGGGGNFGVVTRYWVRAPGATSDAPADLLPKAPGAWRSGFVTWSWETMTEEAFTLLLRNFGTWYERNSDAGTPTANLSGFFSGTHCSGFGVTIGAAIDDGVPDAERLFSEYFEAISAGVGIEPAFKVEQVRPWLYIAAWPGWGDPGSQDVRRIKIKAGYLRQGYTSRQIAAIYQHLSDQDHISAELILVGYGGQVNTVAPDETALAQRDSILKAAYLSVWGDAADDAANLERVRNFYQAVYADTGGVPVPNEFNDGSYINYPDADLADPALNTSGVPWQTLYYKDHYPRLQTVKKRYDPLNVFRHRLSIEAPA